MGNSMVALKSVRQSLKANSTPFQLKHFPFSKQAVLSSTLGSTSPLAPKDFLAIRQPLVDLLW